MIYPRLGKVGNGQRMSVELVNGLIKRTEYAADLLRQYKLLAGSDINIQASYDGTAILASASAISVKYRGYIVPSVPSENDIFLELDKPFDFPGGELGGLYARDLPLNQRQKIVYPEFVLLGSYKLVYSFGYWANFDAQPNSIGFYPSLSGTAIPPYSSYTLGGSNGYPSFGPHPNAGVFTTSFFEGGFIMLVKN